MGGYEGEVRDYFFECQAGVSVASVLLDGSIGACPSIRADYTQGNIYKDDLWDVWQNRYEVYRDLTNGCDAAYVPTAPSGDTAKVTACTCETPMATSCTAISINNVN